MASRYDYIAFEGPIGSDTRDLARMVAEALDAELISDLEDNPFLDAFFKDRPGAAFQCQLFFLLNRYQRLEQLRQRNLFKPVKVTDFIMEKDRIYAYQTLSDSELVLYEKLYPLLTAGRIKPDLVVYLQMSPKRIMENLKKRKEVRGFHISPDYVETIVEGYNRFFFNYDEAPLIMLNANEVNFEKDHRAFEDLLAFFERDLRGVTYFNPLPES